MSLNEDDYENSNASRITIKCGVCDQNIFKSIAHGSVLFFFYFYGRTVCSQIGKLIFFLFLAEFLNICADWLSLNFPFD